TIDDCWEGWAILLRQKQKKLIMLPSETMIWQPEFTIKHSPGNPGRFIRTTVPAYAGLRLFDSCATGNDIMPLYMCYAHINEK
ncbi:TPA: hypothetical protein ACHW3U_005096, partial [Escherichia coli]